MASIPRIGPEEAFRKAKAGEALLVCAYEDPAKFPLVHLEGAISLQEFRAREGSLEREQELIFYCA
jgi:hypothetical protein